MRRRILVAFERAEDSEDEAEQRRLLTFVIICGGPTGVDDAVAIARATGFRMAGYKPHPSCDDCSDDPSPGVSDRSVCRARRGSDGGAAGFHLGPKRGRLGDGQLGDEHLSFGLRAQQDGDDEDGQAHDRGDKDRARKGDIAAACVIREQRCD